MTYRKKEDIIENLKDAGCDEEDISCFLHEFCEGNKNLGIRNLRNYRLELLDNIHDNQQKLDCLDYFLYKLEQNEVQVS